MPTAFITAPPDAASDIARTLVDERLAACVNRFDCTAVYRWDGDVHEDDEVILLAKTEADQYSALADRVDELHPYEVPCIERFDETALAEKFANWRAAAVGPDVTE